MGTVLALGICACEGTESSKLPKIDISTKTVTIPAEGGTGTVTAKIPVAWTADITGNWCTVTPTSGEAGEEVTLTFSAQANETGADRECKAVISSDLAEDATITVKQPKKEEPEHTLTVDPTSAEIPVEGATITVKVTSDLAWTVDTHCDWVTAQPASGEAGETEVTLTVASNAGKDMFDRSTDVEFIAGELAATVGIQQEAEHPVEPALSLSAEKGTIGKEGGEVKVTVSANISWTTEVQAAWITVSPKQKDIEEGQEDKTEVTVTVEANPEATVRAARITFVAGGLKATYAIEQEAGDPPVVEASLSLSAETAAASKDGGEVRVKITTNVAWTASTQADWIMISPEQGEAVPEGFDVVIMVQPNTTTEARTATVVFAAGELTAQFTITQEAQEQQENPDQPTVPSLSLSQYSGNVSKDGGSVNVTLESNVAWKVVTDFPTWVSVNPASGQAGSTEITLTVEANPTVEARSAQIIFTDMELKERVAFALAQEAGVKPDDPKPYLNVNPTSVEAPADGGEYMVAVDANVAWTVNVAADWITVTPQSGAEGTAQVKIAVAKNTATQARTASVSFVGATGMVASVAVAQAAAEQQNPDTTGGIDGDINDWGDGGEIDFEEITNN